MAHCVVYWEYLLGPLICTNLIFLFLHYIVVCQWNKLCFVAEIEEIFCSFEEKCAFEDELSMAERWTPSDQRKTKWDNTLNIGLFG